MIVKQILAMKAGPDEIVTVSPDLSIAEAAAILSKRRIGAVVVSTDGKTPAGILSERDIVREIGAQGAAVLDRKVSDLMTAKVLTCSGGDHVRDVLARMTDGRFRHMPVVDDAGAMLGVISIGDAVSARLKQLASDRDALQGMIMGA
ncbi:MAG: histidine kinase [Paracoccus denitrificans]|nr:MAG: histidine kinase [Paracoccus denitrificans]PZO85975.1 MAG: histidine kinase [Paracoccus denitrificans]